MAETGGREAQRNNMNTATPGDSSTANQGSNNRQNGQQTSPQTPWNPASYYMFLQSYYQSYYYQLAYYSQLYNWQLLTSSQPGLLAGSSESITAAGTQPLVGQNLTPQNNQQAPVQTTGLLARNQPQAGACEVRIGTIPRRIMAELIDFVFLYFTKFLTFAVFYNNMDQYNQLQYTLIIDENTTINDLEEIIVQGLAYRFLVFAYEVFFLIGGFYGSLGGATPGKYLMGLSVVSADQVHTLAVDLEGEKVRVTPGGNLGLWRAFLRAMVKNFSMTFLFPVFLTILFFQHNRTIYDIIAGSVVVSSNVNQRQRQQ